MMLERKACSSNPPVPVERGKVRCGIYDGSAIFFVDAAGRFLVMPIARMIKQLMQ